MTEQMKMIYFIAALMLTNNSFACLPTDSTKANQLMKRILSRLNVTNEISYRYDLSANYFSEDYHRKFSTKVYIIYDGKEPIIGMKFIEGNNDYLSVFDGNRYFYVDKKNNTIRLNEKPNVKLFSSNTFLVNSIYTLKHFLPTVITSNALRKTSADTIINRNQYKSVSFTLKNNMMNRFGKIEKLDIEKNVTYTVIIDDTDFPYQVIQRDDKNPKDYMSVTFSEISIGSNRPAPTSWQYETYLKKYKPVSK